MIEDEEVKEVINDLVCGNKELDDLNLEILARLGL